MTERNTNRIGIGLAVLLALFLACAALARLDPSLLYLSAACGAVVGMAAGAWDSA